MTTSPSPHEEAIATIREAQGGFIIGDQVRIVGRYAQDWCDGPLFIAGIEQKKHGVSYVVREEGRWDGFVDGWRREDLELVSNEALNRLCEQQKEQGE